MTQPMRVLDIDLDFFLADCCPLAEMGERPVLKGHEPWAEHEVVRFLEAHCGLNAAQPIPGRIFDTHDKALCFWEEQLAAGRLRAPFHVTHVDAHSDLGIGWPGPGFVLNTVLARVPDARADLDGYYAQRKLDEANYLLFALAMRRVCALDNVRNPCSRADIPAQVLCDGRTDLIRLSSLASRLLEGRNGPEPEIPFHVYDDWTAFRVEAPYDFVTLALSPRYAPAEADALAEVIARYITPV